MNEEALEYSYNLFKNDGYNGTIEDYKKLVQTDSEALSYSYNLFKKDGYQDGIEDFQELIGLKKKDVSDSTSGAGSSEFVQVDNEALALGHRAVMKAAGVPDIFGGFLSNAVTRGLVAGSAADETFKIMSGGKELSDDDINEYIKINKAAEAMGQSDEMKAFNKKYDENVAKGDSGIWAFMKGIYDTPSVAAEVAITSMAQMAASGFSSGETAAMVAAGAGTGAAIGATAGAIGGPLAPVSSTIGAIGGSVKGAMAAAGGITEVAASFTEFLREELNGKEFTQENIREVLSNEESKQKIINKSLARGATVAVIDFLAAGASGKAVSSIKSVGRTGKALKGVSSTAIEAVGGATGETSARLVTGQTLDTKEILFEAVGEAPGSVVSGPIGMLSSPKYSINNSRLTKKDFLNVVKTSTDQELLDMNIKIDNDEGMSDIFNDRIKKAVIKKDIDPSITDEKDIEEVVDLELKIKDFKNRKTSSAKNKVKEFENRIKEIQSKYDNVDSDQSADQEFTVDNTPPVTPTVTQVTPEKVLDAINRPVTLTQLGGSTLETPLEGDMYVEGQQVVVEDADGNITEIGNIDEISNANLEDLGVSLQESNVQTLSDGNLKVGEDVLVPKKAGIKRNKKGEVSRVVLQNEDGSITRTLRGANAEEAAYQILLKEATSPEQADNINQLLEQDDEFRKITEPTQEQTTPDTQQAPVEGNRLTNEPLQDATRISDKFAERTKRDKPRTTGLKSLVEETSKRISDAFDKLTPTPNDPKTSKAYKALAEETLEQYKTILEEGYSVVIDNTEPYNNSKEMIDDLRDNKRMRIFSTESGFGDKAITDQQRQDNPLLQDSGFKDANGQPLLVNDVFRFVHDFFGHAKVGNSFGPKGEEIAWQVHSQMYSPDARRAMTTETRGQNSWVNFSGVNDKAFAIRDEARALRKQANETTDLNEKRRLLEEAKSKVEEAYSTMMFAEQKIGLLPDEFVFESPIVEEASKDIDEQANNIIDEGLRLNLDKQKILSQLKDLGYDPNESNRLIKEKQEAKQKKGIKEEGMFDPSKGKIYNFFDKAYRYALSPKGFLSKTGMIAMEVMEGFKDAEVKIANNNINALKKEIKKFKGDKGALINSLDQYIRGDKDVDLPDNIKEIAFQMRTHIDNLSIKLMQSGAIESQESIENIRNNIGSYLNRSYEMFDKKDYAKSISESVMNAARQKLKQIHRGDALIESEKTGVDVEVILEERVDKSIEDILSQNEANEYVASGKKGAKNLTTLIQRKDIPKEIRALMGEYGDASFNYINSVSKISSIVANQRFLETIKKNGEGVYFFKEPTGEFNVPIAGEGSKTYNPLNGYFTSKEMKEALTNDKTGRIDLSTISPLLGKLNPAIDIYMKVLGEVKKSKTIRSIGTQMKNVIGVVPVLTANGYVTDFGELKNALNVANNELRNLNKEEQNALIDEYLRLGIINSSIGVGEIKKLINKENGFEDAMLQRMSNDKDTNAARIAKNIYEGLKVIDKKAVQLYQTTDDVSKIMGFEIERKRYAKALFNKEFTELSADEKQQINETAAEIIKNNIPNYNRVGGAVKALKVVPVAGTFISFAVESIRTGFNTVNLAISEIKDPKTRDIGKKRLTGTMAVAATTVVIPALFGLDIEDEDEEFDIKEKMKMLLAPWDRNSQIVISDQPKNGEFSYISMSASDPYGGIVQAVNAGMSGENMIDGMLKFAGELISPFFEKDILLKSVEDIGTSIKNGGGEVFDSTDTFGTKSGKVIIELLKLIEPGTLTSARKIGMSDSVAKEALGQMTGFKPRKISVKTSSIFIARDVMEEIREIRKPYNRAKFQYKDKKATKEDLIEAYNRSNEMSKEAYQKLIDLYKLAMYTGTKKSDFYNSLKSAGVPNYIIKQISTGSIQDMNE